MRRALLLLLWAPSTVAFAIACASSDDEVTALPPPAPPGETTVPDAAAPVEAAAEASADAAEATCSAAGWCTTAFPDVDLEMKDIWPIADGTTAFAIAESATRGVKVLAWDKASNAWKYIDDNTQNAAGRGKYAGGIWAPNANEAYYTVEPATVYRGTRPADATAPWSWARFTLADHSPDLTDAPGAVPHDHGHPMNAPVEYNYPALGVWGTSSTDVYAWYANTIYHWSQDDAGALSWIPEYTADDVESDPEDPNVVEHIYVVSATGLGPDDIWFSGTRDRYPYGTACAILIHKTPAGYTRIADGVVPSAGGKGQSCQERRGVFMIGGSDGWLWDIQARALDRLVGLKGGRDVMRLSGTEGNYTADFYNIPQPVTVFKSGLSSLWTPPDVVDDLVWMSGFGLLLQGTDVWTDESPFTISTISLNGAPTRRPIYRVRGASSHDLWAVGVRYAFHKTTP